MTLHLVLLPLMLAVSLASAEQCASSVGSRLDLSVHGHKNASGDWIITVDTRRLTSTEKQWELNVNVQQERISCDSNEIEHLISVTSVHPSSHGSSMPAAVQPVSPCCTTTSTQKSCPPGSSMPGAVQPVSPCSTTTSTRMSCPPGYQAFPGFNCYKIHINGKNWENARLECTRDGGDLMVIETERERKEAFLPLRNAIKSQIKPWIGVYFPQGEGRWMTVKGEPALGSWWLPGEPVRGIARNCAGVTPTGLLKTWNCAAAGSFICEVPV